MICFVFTVTRSFSSSESQIVQRYIMTVEQFLQYDDLVNSSRAAQLWPTILSKCFESLRDDNLVMMLVKLIMRGYQNQVNAVNLHHFMECFSGSGNLTRELLRAGYSGTGLDSCNSESQNILDPSGFELVVNCLTALRHRGLLWLGTPCSSFVVLCRAQSARNLANSYLGDQSRGFVVLGNCLGELSALLFFLSSCLGIWAVLEQPQSSCLPVMATMKAVLRFFRAQKYTTYMGQYGGASMKPLQIWSTWSQMSGLQCPRPETGGGEALVIREGKAFTGRKQLLELSQVYTACFGRAVAQICQSEWHSV